MNQQSHQKTIPLRLPVLSVALFATLGMLVSIRAAAEDGETTPPRQSPPKVVSQPKTVRELIDASLSRYQVFQEGDALPAKPIVVLRWANNARGSQDGATLLYVHDGLPLAVACVYPWEKRLEFGFDALARRSIIARQDGVVLWQPQQSGVSFVDIPNAPIPETARPQRLRQMKSLVKRFEATMLGWKADSSDREELRLLPTPVFRYSPKQGKILDGAVFAFATGTDPEVLLQLELVEGDDKPKWQYGFARRTSGALQGRLDESVVWSADRFPVQTDPRRSYFTVGIPLPKEVIVNLTQAEESKP